MCMGKRWRKIFADKRDHGECVNAKLRKNVLIELKRKVWIYDMVRKYGRL